MWGCYLNDPANVICAEDKSSASLFLQKKMSIFSEETMRCYDSFWGNNDALGLVTSIILLMLFLQWKHWVAHCFLRNKCGASLFLQQKIKCLIIPSEKMRGLIISSEKNELPHYFFGKKWSPSLFLQKKWGTLLFLPKKMLIFSGRNLKKKLSASFFFEEIMRRLFFFIAGITFAGWKGFRWTVIFC